VSTYLIELGGGGATLFNPRGNLRQRQRLELELLLPTVEAPRGPSAGVAEAGGSPGRPLKVKARVVRTSRKDSRIHVEFEPLRHAERDRIVSYVLSHMNREAPVSQPSR
jgi:hypothetical protein